MQGLPRVTSFPLVVVVATSIVVKTCRSALAADKLTLLLLAASFPFDCQPFFLHSQQISTFPIIYYEKESELFYALPKLIIFSQDAFNFLC